MQFLCGLPIENFKKPLIVFATLIVVQITNI